MSDNKQEVKELRRQVEILRAQLKGNKSTATKGETTPSPNNIPGNNVHTVKNNGENSFFFVREDIKKSLLITTLIFLIIACLTITQPQWLPFFEKIIS